LFHLLSNHITKGKRNLHILWAGTGIKRIYV